MSTSFWKRASILLAWAALAAVPATAAVTMTADDGGSQSSFNTGANWSDGNTPIAGVDYIDASHILRTPATSSSYTFAGNSLTFGNGTNTANLIYKGSSSSTLTFNTLYLNKMNIQNGTAGATATFAGSIVLQTGGATFDVSASGRGLAFSATAILSGVGGFATKNSGASGSGTVTLSGVGNSYSGGTTVGSYTLLDVKVDGGLGTGNVTVADTLGGGAILKLEAGTTNNYIADTAALILSGTSPSVVLNFTGSDTVAGLSFDGGTTWSAAGTWGAIGSGATYTSADFTGTGWINVAAVPENGTLALVAFAFFGLAGLRARASGLRA